MPFYKRIFFWVMLPVIVVGLGVSSLLIYYLSEPVESYLKENSIANMRLASNLGIEICEKYFTQLLDLRLEDNLEMNKAFKKEAEQEIKAIAEKIPNIQMLLVEGQSTIRMITIEYNHDSFKIPLANEPRDSIIQLKFDEADEAKATIKYFPFWDWHIVSFVKNKDYIAPISIAREIIYFCTIGVLLTVVITLLLTFYIYLNRPLNRLIFATQDISKGIFKPVESSYNNEIGQLIVFFNRMVKNLKVNTDEINLLIESQKESEERYRSLVELSPEAVIVHQDYIIQYINTRGTKLFSAKSPAVMIGKSLLDFIHPASLPLVRSRIRTIISEQATLPPTEVLYVDSHQNMLEVEATGTHIDFAGKPAVLSVLRDISERKKTERALRENEKRLQSLIDNVLFGLLVYDWPSGRLQYINPRGLEMLGYTSEDVEHLTAWDIYHESEHEILKGRLHSKITGDLPPEASRTYRMNKKNGESFSAEANGVLMDLEGQRVLQVVMSDVTERERLQEQLQMAQKMEAVGILAGGIAHDFNNILAAITGFSELALKDNKQEIPAPEKIEQILAAADRAKELVQQILTFSRRAEFEIKPVNLNEEINKVISILERTIPKMISINLNLAQNLMPCNGDHNQIQQVLLNLANNAKDAMPDGGQLTIKTGNLLLAKGQNSAGHKIAPGEYVQLTVADTGQGMDKKTLDHIFEPFYTTKDVGKGTGLGLASVYGIIEGHNGSIECLSEVGAGTTFRILLPALNKGTSPADAAETNPDLITKGTESILLVDDEESLRDLGREIFSEFGYQTITASNGEEAIEVYRQTRARIDLVVLDINMPGMGGMKCLQELITIDPAVKVIIASGYSGDAQLKDMLDSGALAYLTKPFNMATMLKTVREVLDS